MTRTRSTFLITVLLAAGLAGCDSGGPAGSGTPSATPSISRQQLLTLGQEWVQCLRSKGLTRMPDAQLSSDGYLTFQPVAGYNWKEEGGRHPEIIQACKSIEDKYPPNAFRPKDKVSAADLAKLQEYAKCFRAHGLPAWPDPGPDGSFNLTGTPLEHGIPKTLQGKATDACRSIWSGQLKIVSGPGMGKGGKK
jgi:hypothetical protein